MKRECPQCGFELREMGWYEKFVHEKLERASTLEGYGQGTTGFDIWLDLKVGDALSIPDLGPVYLVESQVNYDFEYAENQVYVVLRVGESEDSNHFIKHGPRDSYGGATWDGDFRAVSKQTRTTWIWEENA
jgi:hypothetical protein